VHPAAADLGPNIATISGAVDGAGQGRGDATSGPPGLGAHAGSPPPPSAAPNQQAARLQGPAGWLARRLSRG